MSKENTMLAIDGESTRKEMVVPEVMKKYATRQKPGSPAETYNAWREARIKEKMERDEFDEELNELVNEANKL